MKAFFISFCVLLSFAGNAQVNAQSLPKFSVKIGIWPLLNTAKTSIDIGFDYKVSEFILIDLEIGPYIGSEIFANDEGETYTGWRIRPGFKVDIGGVNFGFIYKFEFVENKRWYRLLRQGGAYTELYLTDRHLIVNGMQFRLSRAFPLTKNGRFIIEPFMRFGLQRINVSYGLPSDAELLEDTTTTISYSEGNYIRPDFYVGINIGFAWW